MASLSNQWQKRLDRAGEDFVRTSKGTKVTQSTVDAIARDEEGIKVIADHTDEVIESLGIAIGRGLEAIGIQAEGYAKDLCPVDTGRLRNSITHTIDADEKAAYIGTNVEYGPYVEMGTSRQKEQPFLRPAAQNHGDEYREILESELKGS